MAKVIKDEEVFEAVLETLVENGYGGSTTKLIAKKAGINEVTLFRKYGSKGELVAAAVAYERYKINDEEIRYSGDLRRDLLTIVQAYFAVSSHQSKLFPMIVSEMLRYPELRETMKAPHSIILMFGEIIGRYQHDGSLKAGDPVLVVMNLLGPVIVNTMLRVANPDLELPAIDLESHVDNFLYGNLKS